MQTLLGWGFGALIIYLIYKFFTWIFRGVERGRSSIGNYWSIREAPALIKPLESYDFNPSRASLVAYKGEEPVVKGGVFNMNGDHTRLTGYINDVDRHRVAAQNAAQLAINRFEYDHLALIDQQRQLFRRVFQAKKYIRRFRELESLKPSLNNLPEKLRIGIPIPPKYPTPNDIARKYTLIPQNTGNVVGRALTTNGGLSNQGNILGLAAVAVITLFRANSNISKLKRVAEDARGQVSNYALEMRTTMDTLELSHREMVQVSAKLKQAEQEIQNIVGKVAKISPQIKYLNALEGYIKANVEQLYYLMMYAEMQSRRTF